MMCGPRSAKSNMFNDFHNFCELRSHFCGTLFWRHFRSEKKLEQKIIKKPAGLLLTGGVWFNDDEDDEARGTTDEGEEDAPRCRLRPLLNMSSLPNCMAYNQTSSPTARP